MWLQVGFLLVICDNDNSALTKVTDEFTATVDKDRWSKRDGRPSKSGCKEASDIIIVINVTE